MSNPMTNYNERLDEQLTNLGERHIMVEHRLVHLGMPEQNGKNIETRKAKQAITSLIKELVAEAKPEEYEDFYASNPVEKGRKMGYNEATREFEQNLLKELEEV